MVPDLKAVVGEYDSLIRGYVANRIGSGNPAFEDIVQNIYLSIWVALPNFQERSQLKTYIYTIVKRKVVDYLRKKIRDDRMIQKVISEHDFSLRSEESTAVCQPFQSVTRREMEVLRLLSRGFDNDMISSSLHISKYTVRSHVKALYRKLGVRDRGRLVHMAIQFFREVGNDGGDSEGANQRASGSGSPKTDDRDGS